MEKITHTALIVDFEPEKFSKEVNKIISQYQNAGKDVELQFSCSIMLGIMNYNCFIIVREKEL
jgi:hypothetical protein